MNPESKTPPGGRRSRLAWGCCLIVLWCGVVLLFYRMHGNFTLQELLRYRPDNPLLAALAMCGLFLLKSVDFIIFSPILYAASGIMYPLPAALCLNLIGAVILSVVPYFIGQSLGTPLLEWIYRKYPKFRETEYLSKKGTFLLTVVLRCVGIPVNIVSLYMGAAKFPFGSYLAGSVLGLLPGMLPYTVMGETAADFRSPVFAGALAVRILTILFSAVLYHRVRKT